MVLSLWARPQRKRLMFTKYYYSIDVNINGTSMLAHCCHSGYFIMPEIIPNMNFKLYPYTVCRIQFNSLIYKMEIALHDRAKCVFLTRTPALGIIPCIIMLTFNKCHWDMAITWYLLTQLKFSYLDVNISPSLKVEFISQQGHGINAYVDLRSCQHWKKRTKRNSQPRSFLPHRFSQLKSVFFP